MSTTVGDITVAQTPRRRRPHLSRLVKLDLAVAIAATLVILGVTVVDHAAQGSASAAAGLIGF